MIHSFGGDYVGEMVWAATPVRDPAGRVGIANDADL